MLNKAIAALLIAFGIAAAPWGAQQAHAASIYDNVISNSLVSSVSIGSGEFEQDVTTTWFGILDECDPTAGEALQDIFTSGIGSWAVIDQPTGDPTNIQIIWTASPSTSTEFFEADNWGVGNIPIFGIPNGQNWNRSYLGKSGPTVGCFTEYFRTAMKPLAADPWSVPDVKLLFSTFPVTYPDGYAGVDVPESAPEPGETSEEVPDWIAVNALDWKVTLSDQNFNTFDGIFWTCSEDGNSIVDGDSGLAPVLYWEIYDSDTDPHTMLDSGVISSTVPLEWQAPKVNEQRNYTIVGWYDCGGTLVFTESAVMPFTITMNGLLGSQDLMEDCVVEEFPWINISGCISNLGIVINAISFGFMGISNDWGASTSCRNLSVLGGWINAPGQQVCPFFPSYVRDVVTPFVTFMLGLLMVRFLSTRSWEMN